MSHSADVRKAGDDPDGIRNAFPLGGGRGGGVGKPDHAPAQIQHGGLKAEPGTGAGLIKAGGQLFSVADMGVF